MEEFAWFTLAQIALHFVLSCALQKQPVNVGPIFRPFHEHVYFDGQCFRLELKSVNGQFVLSSLDLHDRRHKALWEEQRWQPLRFGRTFRHPRAEETDPLQEVLLPGSQWLQTRLVLELRWYLAHQHGGEHLF